MSITTSSATVSLRALAISALKLLNFLIESAFAGSDGSRAFLMLSACARQISPTSPAQSAHSRRFPTCRTSFALMFSSRISSWSNISSPCPSGFWGFLGFFGFLRDVPLPIFFPTGPSCTATISILSETFLRVPSTSTLFGSIDFSALIE